MILEKSLVAIFLLGHLIVAEDWCQIEKDFCTAGKKHIACNNDASFQPLCAEKGTPVLEDIGPYKRYLLNEHNRYRNLVAAGEVKRFPEACRMGAIMIWDDDLQYLAELNVKTCNFAHDQCRSTKIYKFGGQNIGFESDKSEDLRYNLKTIMRDAMDLWFIEHKDATPEQLITSYKKTVPQIGHFAQMVNDRIVAMGCAAITIMHRDVKKREHIFTCDYSAQTIHGLPCYRAGEDASWCRTRHPIYRSLCIGDDIDTNDIHWYKKVKNPPKWPIGSRAGPVLPAFTTLFALLLLFSFCVHLEFERVGRIVQ